MLTLRQTQRLQNVLPCPARNDLLHDLTQVIPFHHGLVSRLGVGLSCSVRASYELFLSSIGT